MRAYKIQDDFFKPAIAKYLFNDWKTGVFLLLIFSILRVIIVLQANITRSYQTVALIFVIMILLPFLLLTSNGRRLIGMRLPRRWIWLLVGTVAGATCCAVIYFLTTLLFPAGEGNPFVYISRTYAAVPPQLDTHARFVFFIIYSGTGMLFSPLGEELFYRGLIHECFAGSFGDKIASVIDSAAFSLVHLSHFGIIYSVQGWKFLPFPSVVWVVALFCTCILFYQFRVRSGSILGAVVTHAAFNVAMNYFIFYHIL